MKPHFDVALATRATLGEGSLWDDVRQRLLWVDILEKRVCIFDPATGLNREYPVGSFVGTVVPTQGTDLMVALREGFARLDTETGLVTDPILPLGHAPERVRFNDGKCDPAGRFWAGTMALEEAPNMGALYCLEADGTLRNAFGGVSVSNGMAWSLDRTRMYYIDSATAEVASFSYNQDTGTIGTREVAVRIPAGAGSPDGMTIDDEGMLWVALWDGAAVARFDPASGRIIEKFELPMARPTSCAFGGPNLDILFVTSARVGLSPEDLDRQPLAGSILSFRPGARGVPAFRFAR